MVRRQDTSQNATTGIMSVLRQKNILLGVTAGIAAYKTAYLVRLLVKLGANVKVVMTPEAKNFVTPLTLSTLSKNPVLSTFYDKQEENELWNNHIDLGLWADIMLITPTTANTLAKMANGTCDNLLLAVYLSARCPVYFAPAMDLDMYKHPSTKINLKKMQDFGRMCIPATKGELASGLVGKGRMAEPERIIKFIEKDLVLKLPLHGKTFLITAGPTYEAIDPVRFIGNYSSGKMGFELSEVAADLGARVILISGPSHQKSENPLIQRIDVVSAAQMYQATHQYYNQVDVAILSAAVADYKPKNVASKKIKKQEHPLALMLEPTKDILASLGKLKKHQFLIGFALETHNGLINARAKLKSKNLDMIVLNSLEDAGAGFSTNTNKVTIIDKNLKETRFELKSKTAVAKDIIGEFLKKTKCVD